MPEEIKTVVIPENTPINLKFNGGKIFFSNSNGLFEILKGFMSNGGTNLEDVGINLSKD